MNTDRLEMTTTKSTLSSFILQRTSRKKDSSCRAVHSPKSNRTSFNCLQRGSFANVSVSLANWICKKALKSHLDSFLLGLLDWCNHAIIAAFLLKVKQKSSICGQIMLTEVSFIVRMWLQVVSQEVVHRSSSFVRIKPKASFQARRSLSSPTVVLRVI